MGGLNSGPHRSGRLRSDRAVTFDAMAHARSAPAGALRHGLSVHLSYGRGEGLQPVVAHAELFEVRCGLGGRRWLFVCPVCPRRARFLYGGRPATNLPHRIACRHCQVLRYPSQCESAERRWRRQLAKIEAKLGGDPRKVPPPKGRARVTYERLVARHRFYAGKIAARRQRVLASAMAGKHWPASDRELQQLRARYGC